jgi:iron(III) transport system ATP-binding protein
MSSPVLELRDVRKRFWPGPVEAVDGVSLEVAEGEILTLLGPSGCGKTTTLRLLAGFEVPDEGTIRIGGRTVAGERCWVPPEKRGVGMVFQDYALFPHLTVGENAMFGLDALPRSERKERAMEALRTLDLAPFFKRYPHELSGGQQQRVALARALAPEPVMILMDEPFSNLDAHLRNQVRDEVVAILRRSGVTCILVSHDQRDALAISDRVAVMNRGKIEQVGTPREIYKHPESIFVATFVGRTNLLQGVIQNENGCVLTDFGSFCRVDRLGFPNGTQVMVSVRPDGFEACEVGGLRGRILSATYTGAHVEAEVGIPTAQGGERRLLIHLPPSRHWEAGEEIQLRLDPDFASVVRNACQTLGFSSAPGKGDSPTALASSSGSAALR